MRLSGHEPENYGRGLDSMFKAAFVTTASASSERFVFPLSPRASCSGGVNGSRRAAPPAQAALAETLVNNRQAVVQAAGNNSPSAKHPASKQTFRDDPEVRVQ